MEKTFDALEWLAVMTSHVPNKGEQMVRYYGYYSNVSRGRRKGRGQEPRSSAAGFLTFKKERLLKSEWDEVPSAQ